MCSVTHTFVVILCAEIAEYTLHSVCSEIAGVCVVRSVTHPAELNVDPGCQGSIINQMGTLYTSNANTTHSRSHMAVKISKDQGKTWPGGVAVWSGPSAYSQLVSLGKPATGATFTLCFKPRQNPSCFGILFSCVDAHIRRNPARQCVGRRVPPHVFGFVFSRLVHIFDEIRPCLHAVGVLFEAGAKQAYETISFAVVKVPA